MSENVQTLRAFLVDIYTPLRALSKRSVVLYGHTVDRFSENLQREPTLADLNDVTVCKFLAWRLETPIRGKQVRRTTVKKDRTHLCSLSGIAFRKGLIKEDLVLPPFRAAGRMPVAYTVEDLAAMVAAAKTTPGQVADLPAAWWWETLLRFLYETACRIGETLALEWQDVDFESNSVTLRADTRKGKTRDLVRQISPELCDLFKRQAVERGVIWPWDRRPNCLWRKLRQLCKRAGVEPRGFHSIRKTAASYYAQAGGNASDLLDHSDGGKLFEQHYRDQRIANNGPAAVDMLPPLMPGACCDDQGCDSC